MQQRVTWATVPTLVTMTLFRNARCRSRLIQTVLKPSTLNSRGQRMIPGSIDASGAEKATASTLMNGTIIISIRMTRNAITPHEKSRSPMLCRTTPFAFDGDSVVSWVTGAWSFCTSCMLVGPPESRDLPDDRGHAERRDQGED